MFESKINPYVYKCINRISGEYYFGYRKANIVNALDDLGIRYQTSSKIVKSNFNAFDYFIIAEFVSAHEAYKFEQNLIEKSWGDPLLINNHFTKGESVCFSNYVRTEYHKNILEFITDPNLKDENNIQLYFKII
jgi:hypothetical protein